MGAASIATAFVGAKTSQMQMAVAAKMVKMNANADAAIAQLLEAATQNATQLANAAAGFGQNVDISV